MPRIDEFLHLRKEEVVVRELSRFLEEYADFLREYLEPAELGRLEKLLDDARAYQELYEPPDIRRLKARKAIREAAIKSVGRWGSVRASVDHHADLGGDGELSRRLQELRDANNEAEAAGVGAAGNTGKTELNLSRMLEKEVELALKDKTARAKGEFVSRAEKRRWQSKKSAYKDLLNEEVLEEAAPSPAPLAPKDIARRPGLAKQQRPPSEMSSKGAMVPESGLVARDWTLPDVLPADAQAASSTATAAASAATPRATPRADSRATPRATPRGKATPRAAPRGTLRPDATAAAGERQPSVPATALTEPAAHSSAPAAGAPSASVPAVAQAPPHP